MMEDTESTETIENVENIEDIEGLKEVERYLEEYVQKVVFKNIHRYLRLHKELLKDSVYTRLYNHVRKNLIASSMHEHGETGAEAEEKRGILLDVLADIHNQENAKKVNQYKVDVERFYEVFKKFPPRDIRT